MKGKIQPSAINQKLKKYVQGAGFFLNTKKSIFNTPSKSPDLLFYALPIVSSLVAPINNLSATVSIRNTVINHTFNGGAGSFGMDLDIDQNGTNEFRINFDANGAATFGMDFNGLGSGNNAWAKTGCCSLAKLSIGAYIGAGNVWDGGGAKNVSCVTPAGGDCGYTGCTAPWFANGIGYVGVRFDRGASVHYGWIEMEVVERFDVGGSCGTMMAGQKFMITRIAWETTPNTPINMITVPVQLVEFTAKNVDNKGQLNWEVTNEVNNAGFEIERSENGLDFRSIAWVEGSGNSEFSKQYSYLDDQLDKGKTYYYRLKQVDFNGSFNYSELVTLKTNNRNFKLGEFYPNPSSRENINVDIYTTGSSNWNLTIFDPNGVVTYREDLFLEAGQQRVHLSINHLDAGIYFAKFENEAERYYKKLVIQ